MLTFRSLFILPLVVLLHSCGSNENSYSSDMAPSNGGFEQLADPVATGMESKQMESDVAPDVAQSVDRKLIRQGDIRFQSDNLAETHQFLVDKTKEYAGYISDETSSSSGNMSNQSMVIRVPSNKLDPLVSAIMSYAGELDYKNIRTEDVTMQFIDVTARLQTKKELEAQFRAILIQAKTVEDILNVEREIANLRSDIESMEGQLRYMTNQIDLSTLRIEFYTKSNSEGKGFMSRIKDAFSGGWDLIQTIVVALFYLWPLILVFVLLFFIFRRMRRKKRAGIK